MEQTDIINPDTMRQGALLVGLLAVDYAGVLAAILADLRSGVLKARRKGERRTSSGFRRTVEKASRYYVTLFAMTVIDLLVISAVTYLRVVGGWSLPPFPLFTTIGAVGLSCIELKSIYENSQEKGDYDTIRRALTRMMTDREFRAALDKLLGR